MPPVAYRRSTQTRVLIDRCVKGIIADLDKSKVQTYQREDIPNILFNNRFLELFSRPMKDRPAFMDDTEHAEVIVRSSSGSAFYSRFELALPEGSTISLKEGRIEIDSKYLSLSIAPKYEGANTYIPPTFARSYLRLNWLDVSALQIDCEVDVRFRISSVLSRSGWEYYRWIESFILRVESFFDQEAFFKQLNWPMIEALLLSLRNERIEPKVADTDRDT